MSYFYIFAILIFLQDAVVKKFKNKSGKTVAQTYRAMKRLLNIQDESFLADEFRKMAMFASNYLKENEA
jgi:hypothetical protein